MTHASTPTQPERRTFFHWLTYAVGAAATAILSVPLVGFLLGALRKKTPKRVRLGPVNDFPEGQTRLVTFDNPISQPWDGMTAHTGVFVCYLGKDSDEKDQFRVLAVNCAHLGCPVSWFPQSGLFMCPCHGGVYYENGERASGPPPRGLFHCVWQVEKDGQLWIEAPHYPSLQDTLNGRSRR
jgi:menaquinol-cytochrome c reductase iron-sulfur subunit